MTEEQFAGFLNTPALWEQEAFGIRQFEFPRLDLASFRPQPIPDNLRLGHRIEHVFKQLLEHSITYELVLHNLPIQQEGITLGEIDFVLKDVKTARYTHIELTYKFYLIDPSFSDPIHRLIGPNRRDTFFRKMEKIKNKQFPLAYSEAGTKALHALGVDPSNMEQQCCFKAQLFQPYGHPTDMGNFNEDCLAGYWLRFDDFNRSEFATNEYFIPTKPEWVVAPHGRVVWKSHDAILADIQQGLLEGRAPMVWIRTDHYEFQKVFVVWW